MALPLEARGRSATVAAMQQGKIDTLDPVGALERTSSDSHLSKPTQADPLLQLAEESATGGGGTADKQGQTGGDAAALRLAEAEGQATASATANTDTEPVPLYKLAAAAAEHESDEDLAAERAIAEARAMRAELNETDGGVASPTESTAKIAASEASDSEAATSSRAGNEAQSQVEDESKNQQQSASKDTSAAAAVTLQQNEEEKLPAGGESSIDGGVASAGAAGSGSVKFDPWLEKVIPEEEAAAAAAPTSHQPPSFARFFGLGSRNDPVATRVSRWMPFDSQSDAKAASRRSASDWWATPEEPGDASTAGATIDTNNAQVTELAPTNPFAADVKRIKDEDDTTEQPAAVSSEADATPADAGKTNASADASDDRELIAAASADDNVAADKTEPAEASAAAAAVTTLVSSTALDEKKLDDSWKLMLKSALLSRSASRDKHSSAVEYHPYIVLLKDDKLCIHHVPEFFREISGKTSSYADQVGKRQPIMELKIEPAMRFGNVERKRVIRDSRARLHIAKLQSWQQREFRGLRALLGSSTRTEVRTVLKVGSASLTTLESFMEAIDRRIRLMPVDMAQEISFRRDEIYCDLVDDCDVMLAFDGTLLSRRSTVHVMVQAYLSGQADCQMVLNDRKLATEQRNNPSGLFLPASKELIDMSHVECHSATNREVFEQSRLVHFTCLKGLRFEALRFQVTGSLPPPLEVRGLLCETVENVVNLRANLKWHPQSGRVRFAVHDIEFHIPVPSSWCGILETKNALGMRRSIKARNSFRGSVRRKRQTTSASLDVSVGSAKYEPEGEALVWRIEDFPTERNANATLTCRLELTPSMERADFENKQCVMRYGVAGSCVSGTAVWSLQVPSVQVKPAKKWVKYDTKFRYAIDMLPSSKYEIAGEDD
eukprot:scpid26500/ scgid15719/ Stonin-1; Stoned B-like factor